jgi:hypothetical protein
MRSIMKGIAISFFVGVMALGAGCSKGGKEGKCDKLFDKMMSIMDAELSKATGPEAEMMKAMMGPIKEEMKKEKPNIVAECLKADEKAIDCALAASSMQDMEKCDLKVK